jgi:hypothetical protein
MWNVMIPVVLSHDAEASDAGVASRIVTVPTPSCVVEVDLSAIVREMLRRGLLKPVTVVVEAVAVALGVVIMSAPLVASMAAVAAPVRVGPVQLVPGKLPVNESEKRGVELEELPLQAEASSGSRTSTAD